MNMTTCGNRSFALREVHKGTEAWEDLNVVEQRIVGLKVTAFEVNLGGAG